MSTHEYTHLFLRLFTAHLRSLPHQPLHEPSELQHMRERKRNHLGRDAAAGSHGEEGCCEEGGGGDDV